MMPKIQLPVAVVQEDNRLETAAEKSREELARHRWHWTLDESNPDRISTGIYARNVARGVSTIRDMANGYAEWIKIKDDGAPGSTTFADCLERAKLSGDRLTATEAVAKAAGVSIGTARRHKSQEIDTVMITAQERAERNNTTPAEEVHEVAEFLHAAAASRKKSREESRAAKSHGFIRIEGSLAAAKRHLGEALDVAQNVEFSDDELTLIIRSIDNVRGLLHLIDLKLGGATDVDWDAELAKLGDAS
jgi:hypothetical protein